MERAPLIHIREAELGLCPEVVALNAAFRKDLPILKLRVEIDWDPKAPGAALSALEAALLEVCPSLRDHQCRGDRTYRVLRSTDEAEAPLALAHLFEHVVIDAISFITNEPMISGALEPTPGEGGPVSVPGWVWWLDLCVWILPGALRLPRRVRGLRSARR